MLLLYTWDAYSNMCSIYRRPRPSNLGPVPEIMADAQWSRVAPLQKVHLDRLHPPLERQCVLQGMLCESDAAASLVDARQEVLYPFF